MKNSKCKQKIEVELRSIFSKEKYNKLKSFFDKKAKYFGKDDKDVYFFILPDKFLKVVNNISKKTAKIVIKLNSISKGESHFEEIEIPIRTSDFSKAVKIFHLLPFRQIEESYQKRHNYKYKGVDIALKWTESWGYHIELEKMVDDKSKVEKAKTEIYKIADELGIKIMTEEELKAFSKRIDANYKKGLYDKKSVKKPI